MTEYKRIDESIWRTFGKNLLSNKGSDEQIKFLQVCRNGKDDFLNYLEENLLNNKDAIIEGKAVFFDHKFTEAEFRFPPIDTQEIIWEVFGKIEREYMGYCGFWGYVTIQMIKHNCITPDYLASELNGVHKTGIYMLDSAINSDDGEKIDKSVRRILRSMGNAAPRGPRVISLKIFPLGKAYWRWNLANKMSNEINLSFDKILKIFDEASHEIFATKMHKQQSYITQKNTLGGLLLFLNKNPLPEKIMGKVIDTIAYLSAWKAIELQSPELNKQEIKIIADGL
jgi:hypothetical protein